MIKPSDLPGVPVDLANAVIAAAVLIAPCIDSLPESDEDDQRRDRVVSTLLLVAKGAAGRGSANVKSQRAGSAYVDYGPSSSWFSEDSLLILRGVCSSAGAPPAGLPVGVFPKPGTGRISRVWPEEVCDAP